MATIKHDLPSGMDVEIHTQHERSCFPWRSRAIHLIAAAALIVIAIDSQRLTAGRPTILHPFVWMALYTLAALAVIGFVVKGTVWTLQFMTVTVVFVGLLRGVTFFVNDQRLTPMGLNVLIALYAVITHRYERARICTKPVMDQ